MKTIENFLSTILNRASWNYPSLNHYFPEAAKQIREETRDLIKEAIKADRANLVEHATAYIQNTREGYDDEAVINKDSIINAPNIELL